MLRSEPFRVHAEYTEYEIYTARCLVCTLYREYGLLCTVYLYSTVTTYITSGIYPRIDSYHPSHGLSHRISREASESNRVTRNLNPGKADSPFCQPCMECKSVPWSTMTTLYIPPTWSQVPRILYSVIIGRRPTTSVPLEIFPVHTTVRSTLYRVQSTYSVLRT